MLVLCKLHRHGGSKIQFGEGKARVEYHFKPLDPKAPLDDNRVDHVAEVTDKGHLGRFLAIEGYELYDGPGSSLPAAAASTGDSQRAAPPPAHPAPVGAGFTFDASLALALAGSPSQPYLIVRDPAGTTLSLVPYVAPHEPAKAPLRASQKKADKPAPAGAKAPAQMSKAELVAAVTEKQGKRPHPSTSEKKLREILAG